MARFALMLLLATASARAEDIYPVFGPRFGLEKGVPHRVLGERFAWALARDRKLLRDAAGFDKAAAFALKNVEKLRTDYVELGAGFYLIQADDDHVLARLLLTARIAALKVKGNPVAFAPARHLVFITGSEDPKGLRLAARRLAKYARGKDAFSGAGIELVKGSWRPFVPEGDGKVARALRSHAAVSWAIDVGRQSAKLRRELGEEINIGSLENDGEGTVAVWTRDVDTLLPRPDRIRFIDLDQPEGQIVVATVPWSRVVAVCPKLLVKNHLFYERYRTRSFPTEDEFTKMRED